jgi:uncharacterized membrane protein ArfC
MSDVNWWLMALAFLLGLVLTFAFMIRRVKREVPVHRGEAGATRAPSFTGAADADTSATAKLPTADADATAKLPSGAVAAGTAAAGAGGAAAAAKPASQEPYGPGSLRVTAGETPGGYTVKGNEDSMLYHTPESPAYKQTIAEIWFRDAEAAERAGFARWDSGKSQRGQR